jgi:hypothetical protein
MKLIAVIGYFLMAVFCFWLAAESFSSYRTDSMPVMCGNKQMQPDDVCVFHCKDLAPTLIPSPTPIIIPTPNLSASDCSETKESQEQAAPVPPDYALSYKDMAPDGQSINPDHAPLDLFLAIFSVVGGVVCVGCSVLGAKYNGPWRWGP